MHVCMDVGYGNASWKAMRNVEPRVMQVVDEVKDMDHCQNNNYAYDVGECVLCCICDAY